MMHIILFFVHIELVCINLRIEPGSILGSLFDTKSLLLGSIPFKILRISKKCAVLIPESSIKLPVQEKDRGLPCVGVMEVIQRIYPMMKRIALVFELTDCHGFGRISEPHGVRLLELIVFQRNDKFLPAEINMLERKCRIIVQHAVGFLIIGPVIHAEREIVLPLGDFDEGRIGKCHCCVTPAVTMVIDCHTIQHLTLLVLPVHSDGIAFYAVIEYTGRDLDLILGVHDIIPHGINFGKSLRHKPVTDEKRSDSNHSTAHNQRRNNPGKRNSGGLYGQKLLVLRQLAYDHHGRKQGRKRQGKRQNGTCSPHHELQYHAQSKTFTYKFVYIDPKKLEKKNKDHNDKCRHERCDK